jgi:hypothetical protein
VLIELSNDSTEFSKWITLQEFNFTSISQTRLPFHSSDGKIDRKISVMEKKHQPKN